MVWWTCPELASICLPLHPTPEDIRHALPGYDIFSVAVTGDSVIGDIIIVTLRDFSRYSFYR